VREYLTVGQKQHRVTKFNATFDVDALMEKEITDLSAGQWQRVAITKVLSQPSSLILMDEPDAPLDSHWSECLNTVLSDVISEGRVIVVTLHRQDIQKSWKYQSLNLTPTYTS
jgi:ABC-type transport system involved in cytochrome c biogenesis ATPase subunit